MKPAIVKQPQMLLVGFSFFGDPFQMAAGWSEENEIGRTWKRFTAFLENHGQTMMDHLYLVTIYLQEYRSLPPERLNEVLATRKHYEQRLMQILEDGISSGDFRPVNVKMTVFGFLGMLNWTHQWFSPDGEFSSEQIAAILSDLALHAVSQKMDH